MRVRWWSLAAIVAAALASGAAAQEEEPARDPDKKDAAEVKEARLNEKAPEIKAASWMNAEGEVTLEKFRERIVLLFFFRSNDSASVEAFAVLNRIHKAEGGRVIIIGLTTEKREKAEGVLKGKEVPWIVGFETKSEETYKVPAPPQIYLIDTAGVLRGRYHPADALEDKVALQKERTPPQGSDAATLKKVLDEAKALERKKQVGRAYRLARQVSKDAEKDSPLAKEAEEVVKRLEEAARKLLEEAREAGKAKDYEKACRILGELSVNFAGTPLQGDIETEIGRLMGDREVKPRMRRALDNANGQIVLDQAAEHESYRRYLLALRLYREVMEKYPGSDAAKAAEQAVDRITNDPQAKEIIRNLRGDAEAERWLEIAERFAKVEMFGKAREYYERIIAQHPNTRAASKARERLPKLPEEKVEEMPPDEQPPEGVPTTRPTTPPTPEQPPRRK